MLGLPTIYIYIFRHIDNLLQTIIIHPPVITMNRWFFHHSHMGGLWHCFNHKLYPIHCWNVGYILFIPCHLTSKTHIPVPRHIPVAFCLGIISYYIPPSSRENSTNHSHLAHTGLAGKSPMDKNMVTSMWTSCIPKPWIFLSALCLITSGYTQHLRFPFVPWFLCILVLSTPYYSTQASYYRSKEDVFW